MPISSWPSDAARNPVKILVVDDIDANLVAMRALLSSDELTVVTAGSGAEALEMLLVHDVALALLDVQMPSMDGYALAELMRGSERTHHVPIIFLTAVAQEARSSFRGYESGAVDFLYKPLDERVLRSKVAVFVELHRQRRTIAAHADELARLAHANALMITALSHDLQEPLTALALNTELVLQRSESPALREAAMRQKSATALLRRQVSHLISLAKTPGGELKVCAGTTDLALLARERWQSGRDSSLPLSAGGLKTEGDTVGQWDARLLATAIDQLLLQAETHCNAAPINMLVDGTARGAVVLRVSFDRPLNDIAAAHLLGPALPLGDLPPPVGAGLREIERIARAHGGSLVASTRTRDGTCFELMLPRGEGSSVTAAASPRSD
ncbi:MAG TPA: response regulator [Ideonella sp.]|uniref:ATP-binding response regulator n=1 Tax=Ideonella sp. TaxID=1929293 RepID=UPI002E2F4D1D|nr:response regulator [Ideonella sp.]HEX5687615.1 response regulator [Ideonella sp.]